LPATCPLLLELEFELEDELEEELELELEVELELELELEELLLELAPGFSPVHAASNRQAINTGNRFLITAAPHLGCNFKSTQVQKRRKVVAM
jgi:hypothetical protein